MSDTKGRSKAYAEAGVDIEAGNEFVGRIKDMVASTFTKGVVTGIGGFGGLFRPELTGIGDPVLVAGADGVGTKLKLAFEFGVHDTVGIDLVAMSVNDVLVQGAKPLFFLDYFATGKLLPGVAAEVVAGVVEGCKQSECALLGGETAEMPGFYPDGEYDLSGFAVGLADGAKVVDGSKVKAGDTLIGLASTGVHSNGFSLLRKVYAQSGLTGTDPFPGSEKSTAEVLLAPTKIYVKPVLKVLDAIGAAGMVHVTGGGFYDNIPRVLPDGLTAKINFGSWPMLPIFDWLKSEGGLEWPEMLQIFNCSIGYVMITDQPERTLEILAAQGQDAWVIGTVEKQVGDEQVEILFD